MIIQLKAERDLLQRNIQNYEMELSSLPGGTLYKKKRGKTVAYFQVFYENKKQIRQYISKKNTDLIIKLQRKKHLKSELPSLKRKLKAIVKCIFVYDASLKSAPLFTYGRCIWDEHIQQWMKQPVCYNTKNLKGKTFMTTGGVLVRSKSELIIANMLESFNLPYKYDTLLSFNNLTLSPDFSIMRPYDKKVFVWEHFGLINDEKYKKIWIGKENSTD